MEVIFYCFYHLPHKFVPVLLQLKDLGFLNSPGIDPSFLKFSAEVHNSVIWPALIIFFCMCMANSFAWNNKTHYVIFLLRVHG